MYAGGANTGGNTIINVLEAQLGLEDKEAGCWPENWQAYLVFAAADTQWNVGQGGAIGLRYETLPLLFDTFGIKKKSRAEMLTSLRIMESEALEMINDRRD